MQANGCTKVYNPSMTNSAPAVLGYTRVSTAEQATNGVGLAAQEAAIRAECERRGWRLVEVVRDEGASGKSLDRPGLTSALERIAAGEVSGLVAAKLDRLSRSVIDFATLLEWFGQVDATLLALDLAIDTSSPGGRLVANVFASVAEWERQTIGERTKTGLARIRAEGRPISRPALADKPELRERIAGMRAAGETLQGIADSLNRERVPTLRGAAAWTPSSVRSACGYKRPRSRRQAAELPEPRRRARAAA